MKGINVKRKVCKLEIWGSNSGRGKRFFSSLKCPHQLWEPDYLIFKGYLCSSLRVKQLRCEVNHSPPSSSRVKKAGCYASAPPIRLYGMDRNNSGIGIRIGNIFTLPDYLYFNKNVYAPILYHLRYRFSTSAVWQHAQWRLPRMRKVNDKEYPYRNTWNVPAIWKDA
jgi:hypothetical protein